MHTSDAPPTRKSISALGDVKPAGPHHRVTYPGLLQAFHASSIGASRIRVTTTSNVSVQPFVLSSFTDTIILSDRASVAPGLAGRLRSGDAEGAPPCSLVEAPSLLHHVRRHPAWARRGLFGWVPHAKGEDPAPREVAEQVLQGVAEPRFYPELRLPVRSLVDLVHGLHRQSAGGGPEVHPLPEPPRGHPLRVVAAVADGDDAEGSGGGGLFLLRGGEPEFVGGLLRGLWSHLG